MHSSRLGKSSKWYNEKRFKKVMALNRKEESLLQQKLDQIQREESFLQREYESKIVKTAQALNARENDGRKISSTTARGRCELSFRGKSSSPLFMKLPNPEILKRRRHTVAGLTSIINKASEGWSENLKHNRKRKMRTQLQRKELLATIYEIAQS